MTLNKNKLKEVLSEIKANEYNMSGDIDQHSLTKDMLENIGDIDPELRDDLIYLVLGNWILKKVYSTEALAEILYTLTDKDHMFYKIGEKGTDSVLTRSFSTLIIPLIIAVHIEKPYLSNEDLKTTLNKLIEYTLAEQDVRGFITEKGWAHSAAHTADALDEIAKCENIGEKELLEILDAICKKISINDYLYFNGEDERMTTAVVTILDRNLVSKTDFTNWINRFTELEKTGDFSIDHKLKNNVKSFLRSMFFRLLDQDGKEEYVNIIKDALNKKELQ